MNGNIWKEFAELNGMSQDEFFNEITLATIAVMSLKIDEQSGDAIKINQGQYTLVLIDNDKQEG